MLLQMNGVGKQKLDYKDHSSIKFDDLKTYILLAKKAISKFGPKFYNGLSAKMLKSEDAISFVTNAIMMADWRWDENRLGSTGKKKTKYSYRNQCALWAIQTYVSKEHKVSKNNKSYSLDYSIEDGTDLHSISADDSCEPPDSIVMKIEERENLSSLINQLLSLNTLSDRQKDYIKLYYFESQTFEQIGNKYGITREAVRQGLNKGLDIIRRTLT